MHIDQYISSDFNKIFYEGVIPYRYIDELTYIDYITLSETEINLLCKKYKLTKNEEYYKK
jgi:hypothetical protein